MGRFRRRDFRRPTKEGPRINEEIRVPRILLIDEQGNKLGEFQPYDAYQLARERGLDLIEVAPNARPPVCRIGDYGRMKYEAKKRENAAKKRRHEVRVKEVKLRPKTDVHDMDVKIRRALSFLQDGNKVKVTVRFRGREHAHHNIGVEQCMELAEGVGDAGKIEAKPRMDGRQMFMLLAPTSTPDQTA